MGPVGEPAVPGGRAAVMPSTPRPWPPRTETAKPRAATSTVVTGRTQPAPLHAVSVILFWASQALYPAAQPRISSSRFSVGPAGAGVASSFSTVPDSRTPLK